MEDESKPTSTAALDAAVQYSKQQLREIDLESRLQIAFMQGVVWEKERYVEELRKAVGTNAR